MGYSKNKFVREIEIKVPFKEIHDVEPAVFVVTIQKHKDVQAVNQWFFSLKDEERSNEDTVLEFIIKTVCAGLTSEPQGFDDFPKNEKTSLYERALAYFTGNQEDEQEMYNDMLSYVYNKRSEYVAKNIFPNLPDDSQGNSDIQSENPEGRSE